MKPNYVVFYLLLCFTTFLNSQNFRGNWNVVSLESNGNIINLPSTVTTAPNINFDSFFSSPPAGDFDQYFGYYIHGNGICNSFTSYFETNTNAITLIPYFEATTNSCNTVEESDFENLFFAILQQPGTLDYSFSNNLYDLQFRNSLGEIINLSRENATTNPLSGEWFIHHIWDYDILFENTFDPGLNIIFSDESSNGQSTFFGNAICNSFGGSYDYPLQTSSFILRNIGWTLIECFSAEEGNFERAYFEFFGNFGEDIFTFEITGSGSESILTISNGYGAAITYGRQALSIDSFTQQQTQLITDLFENKLRLISDVILANTSYSIYNISGRSITSGRLNASKSISIHTLSSGVYILKVQNSQNQSESFKF
jgi:heat shock protein HslJ